MNLRKKLNWLSSLPIKKQLSSTNFKEDTIVLNKLTAPTSPKSRLNTYLDTVREDNQSKMSILKLEEMSSRRLGSKDVNITGTVKLNIPEITNKKEQPQPLSINPVIIKNIIFFCQPK